MYPNFPSFRRQPPDMLHDRFDTLPLSLMDFRGFPQSGLHLWLAGSSQRPAESRSSSYGPTVHLRLLPTSPHGDAVTISYRPESVCLGMTSTSLIEYTFRRTSSAITARRFRRRRRFFGFGILTAGRGKPVVPRRTLVDRSRHGSLYERLQRMSQLRWREEGHHPMALS